MKNPFKLSTGNPISTKYSRHGPVDVQNEIILFTEVIFHLKCKIQTRRLDLQALNITNQFLDPLVRITQALDTMADTRNRP